MAENPRAGAFRAPPSCQLPPRRNKPLMVFTEHWKSAPVLPTFQLYPLASDPACGEARLKRAR